MVIRSCRFRHDQQILRAYRAKNSVEPSSNRLVNGRRPKAHDQHPVKELIPVAVIRHPVQFGDRERAPEARPRVVDCQRHSSCSLLFMLSTLPVATDIRASMIAVEIR
jgi:hypothetical protein